MHAYKREQVIKGRGPIGKSPVVGVRERKGRVKAKVVKTTEKKDVHAFVRSNVASGSTLYTDDHRSYQGLESDYAHESVNHSVGEYVRGMAHTNGIESFWALLKRGYVGVFHHFSKKHLHRYINEFEARWNLYDLGGADRLDKVLGSSSGLRLTYKELVR